MSVPTETSEPAIGSDAALEALFADPAPLPAPASETPSPAPIEQAERATATPGTDAAPPAISPEAVPAPEPAAPPAPRATHPKSWQGTEEEWQAFRAEQNRATNRERDARLALETQQREARDRVAFLEAQLSTRDAHLVENLMDAWRGEWTQRYGGEDGLREYATERLKVSQAAGNESYFTARQQAEAAATEAAAAAQAIQAGQTTAAQAAEADARLTFATHLQERAVYAAQRGVAGLDLSALYAEAFAEADTADDIAESRAPGIAEERRARLVARIYRRADAFVDGRVDAAGAAKATAQSAAPPDTAAGRATALGGTAAGTGAPMPDWSPAAMERELDAHYKAVGWGKRTATPLLR